MSANNEKSYKRYRDQEKYMLDEGKNLKQARLNKINRYYKQTEKSTSSEIICSNKTFTRSRSNLDKSNSKRYIISFIIND
jgi:hypothetical protein